MSKKIISILLAIVLCCTLLSLVFAEGDTPGDQTDQSSVTSTQADDTTGTTGESTTETTAESSTDTSAESSTDTSSESTTDTSAESTTDTSAESTTDTSAESTTDTSAESTTDTSAESTTEAPVESTTEPSTEPSTEPTPTHTHAYTLIVKPATRTEDGALKEYCTGCGDEKSTPIPRIDTIKLSNTNCVYSGNIKHPKVIAADKNGKALKKGTDFEVEYVGTCRDVGKYYAKITFIGRYKGSVVRYFNVIPKATTIRTVKEGADKLIVSVKQRKTQTTGYQIRYASAKSFAGAKNAYLKDPTLTSKTIKGLTSGTTYYVKVRVYTKVKFNGKDIKLYSAWSDIVECKTK